MGTILYFKDHNQAPRISISIPVYSPEEDPVIQPPTHRIGSAVHKLCSTGVDPMCAYTNFFINVCIRVLVAFPINNSAMAAAKLG